MIQNRMLDILPKPKKMRFPAKMWSESSKYVYIEIRFAKNI